MTQRNFEDRQFMLRMRAGVQYNRRATYQVINPLRHKQWWKKGYVKPYGTRPERKMKHDAA